MGSQSMSLTVKVERAEVLKTLILSLAVIFTKLCQKLLGCHMKVNSELSDQMVTQNIFRITVATSFHLWWN